MKYRVVQIEQSIMRKNDGLAAALRERWAASGTLVVNLLSSPGSGKTTLLEDTLARLAPRHRVGALVGDQATDNDAVRLARAGAPVRQITTAAECRLDADMIGKALAGWDPGPLDMLFIENVGNLICPAEYDLGEDVRAVLFSVTEGEDKPLKYPLAFNTVARRAGHQDRHRRGRRLRPRGRAAQHARGQPGHHDPRSLRRTGTGMDAWTELLEERLRQKTREPAGIG